MPLLWAQAWVPLTEVSLTTSQLVNCVTVSPGPERPKRNGMERPAPEQNLQSTKEIPNLKTGSKSSSEPEESQTQKQSLEGL